MPNIVDDRAHDRLCELAKSQLEGRQFIVELEKRFFGGKYIVDVYGERGGEVIMYECGGLYGGYKSKIDWLRKHVGKVIHMPYLDQWIVRKYESTSIRAMREWREETSPNETLKAYLEAVKRVRGEM